MEALAALERLSKGTVAAGVLSAIFLAYLVHSFGQWYRLSHIPGPFWAAFSKYWMVSESLKGQQPTAIKEATDKYGELCSDIVALAWTHAQNHRITRTHWAE